MDRLTISGFDYDRDFIASHLQSWSIAQAVKRLAAYEDTGLAPAEVEAMKQRECFLTEAYDRNAAVHEALTQDYLTVKAERDRFKARAEAAEADMKRIADDMDGETDACYPCALCVKNNSKCDVGDTCFEWRGPQEGANP